jgi:hypothetical protein
MCENAKAINRDRTRYSFNTFSCAHIASAFNFEIEIKNIILAALRTFEFSHGLGQSRLGRSDSSSSHVRGAPKAEVSRALRLLEALDARQNFDPFRLAEACD